VAKELKKSECEFEYRNSVFKKKNNSIILSSVLKFKKDEKEAMQKKVKECIAWRKSVFPESLSPGSFFKHTEPTEHNVKKLKEIPRFFELKLHEKNTIPTGFVIEEAGLMGKKIGGAMVSEKHANFIVNLGPLRRGSSEASASGKRGMGWTTLAGNHNQSAPIACFQQKPLFSTRLLRRGSNFA